MIGDVLSTNNKTITPLTLANGKEFCGIRKVTDATETLIKNVDNSNSENQIGKLYLPFFVSGATTLFPSVSDGYYIHNDFFSIIRLGFHDDFQFIINNSINSSYLTSEATLKKKLFLNNLTLRKVGDMGDKLNVVTETVTDKDQTYIELNSGASSLDIKMKITCNFHVLYRTSTENLSDFTNELYGIDTGAYKNKEIIVNIGIDESGTETKKKNVIVLNESDIKIKNDTTEEILANPMLYWSDASTIENWSKTNIKISGGGETSGWNITKLQSGDYGVVLSIPHNASTDTEWGRIQQDFYTERAVYLRHSTFLKASMNSKSTELLSAIYIGDGAHATSNGMCFSHDVEGASVDGVVASPKKAIFEIYDDIQTHLKMFGAVSVGKESESLDIKNVSMKVCDNSTLYRKETIEFERYITITEGKKYYLFADVAIHNLFENSDEADYLSFIDNVKLEIHKA